jgi:acyl-coenzyme A synthetase/AMP-(fatty) acid ligase
MAIPHRSGTPKRSYPNSAFGSFNVAAERQSGRYGDKPFLTWYDDRRDERIELSYRTFDNWVAKTANLLVDELGAEPGDRVGAALVDHWQTPVVLAASWTPPRPPCTGPWWWP